MEEERDHQKEYQDLLIQMTTITAQLAQIVCDIADIKSTLKFDYVQRAEFLPVRNLIYGAVAMILTAVVGALIALVVTH